MVGLEGAHEVVQSYILTTPPAGPERMARDPKKLRRIKHNNVFQQYVLFLLASSPVLHREAHGTFVSSAPPSCQKRGTEDEAISLPLELFLSKVLGRVM